MNGIMKIKRLVFGRKSEYGIFSKILFITTLVGIGFVFLYPLFYMISFSFKSLEDLLNPSVIWIPSRLFWQNYLQSLQTLNYIPLLLETLYVTILPSVLQCMVAAFVGYGFARFEFRAKNLLLALVLVTFLIPPQVLVIPRYVLFHQMGILDSIAAYALPAIMGQGLNSAIFILIFYQTFRTLPKALEEAAKIDGAGHFRIFFQIALPLAPAAFIVSFLFSFVWYWNETYLATIYFGNNLTTLPLQLQRFVEAFNRIFERQQETTVNVNEGIEMAGTFLTILPLLIVYFVLQKYFVGSIEKSGITGE